MYKTSKISTVYHDLFQSHFFKHISKHVFNLQFNVPDPSSAYLTTLSTGGIVENSTSRSKDLEKDLAEESSSVKISVTLPTKYGVSGSKIKAQRLVSIIQYFPNIFQPGIASFFIWILSLVFNLSTFKLTELSFFYFF